MSVSVVQAQYGFFGKTLSVLAQCQSAAHGDYEDAVKAGLQSANFTSDEIAFGVNALPSVKSANALMSYDDLNLVKNYMSSTYGVDKSAKKPIYNNKSSVKSGQSNYKNNPDYYNGTWNDKPVRFKKKYGDYTFTDDECKALCNGEQITLDLVSRNNKPYKLTGQLSNLEYQGRKYVGFAKVMPEKSTSKKTIPGWMKDVADKVIQEPDDSLNFGL